MRRRTARRRGRVLASVVVGSLLLGWSLPLSPTSGTTTPIPPFLVPRAPAEIPITPAKASHAALDDLVSPKGSTSLVSAGPGGGFLTGTSFQPSISSDGRFVAYTHVPPVVAGAVGLPTPASVVYLADRAGGTTTALPTPDGPVPSGASAYSPSISADGSVVAFVYAPAPTTSGSRPTSIVVWSRQTGTTTYVTKAPPCITEAGPPCIDQSREPAVSGNGRFVAFTSDDPWLAANDRNGASDVFRYDRQSGTVVLVSVGLDGTSAPGGSSAASVSSDGSVIAFTSQGASSIAANGAEGAQVYVRDLNAGSTALVSLRQDGSAPQASSSQASISDDGRFVAFASQDDLLTGVATTVQEAYLYDRTAGTTSLVSSQPDGTPSQIPAAAPAISRDGRMVAYVLTASQRKVLAATATGQVYLHDMVADHTVLISVNLAGQPSAGFSAQPRVAGNGRFAVFASSSTDLVTGNDTNNAADVFLRDMPPVPQLKPPKIDFGTRAVGISPSIAAGVLTNSGWGPLTVKASAISGANGTDFSVVDDGCAAATLHLGESCTVTIGFAPSKAGARLGTLRIPNSFTSQPQTVTLTGQGSSAKIVLDPPIGPPGIVVIATGSGFPVGAQVQLSWTVGITPVTPIVTADANGGFRVSMLVLRNDQVGPRNLMAKWVGGPEFPDFQTPMTVSIAPAAPPRFLAGGAMPQSLVFRG